ncbi:Anaerobic ribonucleoside-triphosphate reductase [Fusobacterium sp. DD29]|uniref:anaerobic ribonucleoside-triphosphate reductase n=1 Tax=unclassified Fusobacterium TaxID=2648384 RepID=UPI001B8C83B5|nr:MULTISPECIES: anaerobic ribonucleoside-triphosphate reductase [unclassified Fusobacterium]MBR8701979.1 Anaerobic ribonucleoside-triphosphate reductase [Fusobacterium sp. DD45]MBR8711780.1 Anaerobic ribonucleoside-triphosphate reductase [Fusobacterium sp. DD28]MBR8749735.1 Anaerobic ribonucleoside-triphosphate reductase [Fusobacterium sp. DD29]MBR8752342.1 Anaerobic ribonucleoside-triphosphate reductase [Fusobacterium sp. DD26]MBR8768014.1 Anaerobic ribonucleoside-triphosphate reductase [Fus
MKEVIKRDGSIVDFDKNRIVRAITMAFKQSSEPDNKGLADKIATQIENLENKRMSVEEIQDLVVKKLMASSEKDIAISYQSYRTIKTEIRNKQKGIYKNIAELVDASNDDMLSENANKDAKTISVQRDLLAGISSKDYYLNKILPKHLKKAHERGEIHIHDLDYLLFKETNCELVDIERMLKGGCNIGNAKMLEPNSVDVAVGHIVQIIASVSSNTYGGCSIPYLDRALVPYIKKSFKKHFRKGLKYVERVPQEEVDRVIDGGNIEYLNFELKEKYPLAYEYSCDLTRESIKQAMQGLEYEINSLSTVNGQTPFTTIGIGTETTWEGRMVQEYVFRTRMEGFGAKKETAIFPKIVYAMCDGLNLNEGDPNWDISQMAFECMTKSIYPDIMFITEEQWKNETVVYPMGCRAFLSPWKNKDGKEIYSGRFNIGATSINLPRIAIKNKGDEAGFYKELDRIMDLCKENSLFRAHYLEKTQAEMAPILWMSGALAVKDPKETIQDLIWGGYATVSIGYIGLSEVSQLLYGKDFSQDEEIYDKTYAILKHIADKVQEFKKETNLGFALYGTPSESLCDRFARIDREEFGDIPGITDKGYYDNSFHVSSHIQINPFEKLRMEALGHKYSAGGHISYIETDSLKNNVEAIHSILKYAQEVGIHYMGINQPVDKCHVCGFKGEFLATERGFECPQCGNHDNDKMSVIRRVCGYLSQPNARPFNKGKQKEIMSRVKHNC